MTSNVGSDIIYKMQEIGFKEEKRKEFVLKEEEMKERVLAVSAGKIQAGIFESG